ncbi:MAG: tRNA dihydrouridine synthase [Coprococcus sp.]
MRLYFAPMEGITGSVYRCAHHRVFGCVDRYYAPFIFTNPGGKISKKEYMEIAPEYNEDCPVIPQLLSNCAEDFIATARTLKSMGYEEVNLNLGCPSNTVVSKGRGAGFLGNMEELEIFLDRIFEKLDMKVSVKTRIGLYSADEFEKLLKIYGLFPIAELIVHPRLRSDYYSGRPDLKTYGQAVERLTIPVCYNGDIFTVDDFQRIKALFQKTDHWMLGRGLLSNPALCREIKGGEPPVREELAALYGEILKGYDQRLNGSKKVIFLMKEFWHFIGRILSEEDQKYVDRLIHMEDRNEFLKLADEILTHCTIIPGQGYGSR